VRYRKASPGEVRYLGTLSKHVAWTLPRSAAASRYVTLCPTLFFIPSAILNVVRQPCSPTTNTTKPQHITNTYLLGPQFTRTLDSRFNMMPPEHPGPPPKRKAVTSPEDKKRATAELSSMFKRDVEQTRNVLTM
jgi:hypothetical protein